MERILRIHCEKPEAEFCVLKYETDPLLEVYIRNKRTTAIEEMHVLLIWDE